MKHINNYRRNFTVLLVLIITIFQFGCKESNPGQSYLEERGMSPIDIVGEAKYLYDMVTYTGAYIDPEVTIENEGGQIFYKTISGEISTFVNYDEISQYLLAYFTPEGVEELLSGSIYKDETGEVYVSGHDEEILIDYIDYQTESIEKSKITYKVIVYYIPQYEGKNPATFYVHQELVDGNWIFTETKEFDWGKSPQ